MGCNNLTGKLTIPYGITSIETNTFYECNSLTGIDFPDGLTSIKNYAFERCSGLTSIELPNRIEFIAKNAFSNCSNLKTVTMQSSIPPLLLGTGVFTDIATDPILIIPKGSAAAYEGWRITYGFSIKEIAPVSFNN